jgi:hypothetical protein
MKSDEYNSGYSAALRAIQRIEIEKGYDKEQIALEMFTSTETDFSRGWKQACLDVTQQRIDYGLAKIN